ncbi:pentatricopeptide repeat-containing protein At2g13600-like [Hibiscus syriacus]|uniref:pentatricopeptide repeat-containing protein At2g13600-like n=1 Tax=Hibiscus syriacus TaxID=106335 RepID=UPI0019212765|nr:pentatricopeptide repeat-containing protein At2g13600-like [Hibiscus syriacus]
MVVDSCTVFEIVGACSSLGALRFLFLVHSFVIVFGLDMHLIAYDALLDAYGKCGEGDIVYRIFNQMSERDVISWTSIVVVYAKASRLEAAFYVFGEMLIMSTVSWTGLIAFFAQNSCGNEALDLFRLMLEEGVWLAHTFVSVYSVCAVLALIEKGKQIHVHMVIIGSRGALVNLFVFNALIEVYCKF